MKELEQLLNNNKMMGINFFEKIKEIVDKKHVCHMDAVLDYCLKNDIEIETAAILIKSNPKLKLAIQIDAEKLNMMKEKPARLPEENDAI